MILFVVKVPILTKAMYMWDDAYSFKIEAFTPGLYDPLHKCWYISWILSLLGLCFRMHACKAHGCIFANLSTCVKYCVPISVFSRSLVHKNTFKHAWIMCFTCLISSICAFSFYYDFEWTYKACFFCIYIFCFHSINIYAGINNLEVGWLVMITMIVIAHNLTHIIDDMPLNAHMFSICNHFWHRLLDYWSSIFIGPRYFWRHIHIVCRHYTSHGRH